ncbi:MAG TPA: lysoplasmalogenase [Acidimicrobiales bacterium]|nr:lysoplasmalogenase [Acidimicrobiales bacterium]
MTATAWALLGVVGVLAVANWWAVAARHRVGEYVTKPATMVALIGVALALDPVDGSARAWFVAALVASLAGDVFLMLPSDRFVEGLASFLVGHLLYVGGLVALGVEPLGLVAGAAVVAVALGTVGRRVVAGARASRPRLATPVTAYLVVISVMVVAAFGTLVPLALVGATLFYASDAMIGVREFLGPFRHQRVAIMSTYHLGQIGLVLALVTA